MSFVFIGNGVPNQTVEKLASLGYSSVRLPSFYGLDMPVSSHPDILLYQENGKVIIPYRYFSDNRTLFERFVDRLVITQDCPASPYPNDVLFDVLKVGNYVIGKKGYVSDTVLGECELISVNQGYARCSTAVLSPDVFITADTGIYKVLNGLRKNVLLISPGNICLEGYDVGFIGGAGGLLPDRRYMFFGDPLTHPDGEKIMNFAEKHNIKTVIGQGTLHDYGGMVFID